MGISMIGTDESVQEIDFFFFFQKIEIRKISVIFLVKKVWTTSRLRKIW